MSPLKRQGRLVANSDRKCQLVAPTSPFGPT